MGELEELFVKNTRRREARIWHHSLDYTVIEFLGVRVTNEKGIGDDTLLPFQRLRQIAFLCPFTGHQNYFSVS